jgi:hypothetical protein
VANFKYSVVRLNDKGLLEFFRESSKIVGAAKISFQMLGSAKQGSMDLADRKDQTANFFDQSEDFTIYNIGLSIDNFSLSISRAADKEGEFGFDQLSVSNNADQNHPQGRLTDEQLQKLNHVISERLLAKVDKIAPIFLNSDTYRTLIRSHQRMTETLQRAATTVGEQIVQTRAKLEDEFESRTSKLLRDHEARQRKVAETLAAGERSLKAQQEEIELRRKDLDDRSNTFARRDLHKALKDKIAERAGRFQITDETKRNRWPIHLAVIISASAMLALLVSYVGQLSSLTSTTNTLLTLLLALKPLGLTVALLGLMAWYLRWMNRWFERYADTEFQLKQFDLDIDRASWVVEAALEWRLHQDKPMPEHLLEKDESADMHPADYLASAILGRASAVNLKVPGGEISLTGRDIRKLQKDDSEA